MTKQKFKNSKCCLNLQRKLSNPRVIYSTATAANDIRQLHYMEKLGLWHDDHTSFVKKLERYGPSAMEMAALQLKHNGKLISRQLGFDGICIYMNSYELSETEQTWYDEIVSMWTNLHVTNGIDNINFYTHLMTFFKIKTTIALIKKSLLQNEAVVVGVQTTGEMSRSRNHQSCLHDLVTKYDGNTRLLEHIYNPIDILINEFGTEHVAEISGRCMRPVTRNGVVVMEKVGVIASEIQDFQQSIKKIAIVTRSGCAGISLHSTTNNVDSLRRHHIILEAPRSAEVLVQQFGRTHRTNSSHKPYYTFVVTNIPSEIRFFNGLTSKLENLGALTKGDRRASILQNIHFEGCSNMTIKNHRLFMLHMNTQIARKWYVEHNIYASEKLNISRPLLGLYANSYELYNHDRSVLFFQKLFLI